MDQNIFLRMNTGVHTSSITELRATSDGSYLVSYGSDKTIRVWDPISQREVDQFRGRIGRGQDGHLNSLVITPDDKYILAAVQTAVEGGFSIRVFDFKASKLVRSIAGWGIISSIQISADQRIMLVVDFHHKKAEIYDYQQFIRTLDRSSLLETLDLPDGHPIAACLFEKDGKYRIATTLWEFSDHKNSLELHEFDPETNSSERIKKIESPNTRPTTIDCNQNHIALQYNDDKRITILDFDGELITEFECTTHPFRLCYSPNGNMLLAGYQGLDGECIVYAADDEYKPLSHFFEHRSTAGATAFLNSTTAVTGGGDDNDIYFWNPETGETRGQISGKGEAVFGIGLQGNLIGFGNTQDFKVDANNYAPLERVVDLDNFDMYGMGELIDKTFIRAKPQHNGRKLEVRNLEGNVQLWLNEIKLTNNPEIMHPDSEHKNGHWFFAETFGFTDDGIALAGSRGDGRIYAIDVDESKGNAGPTYIACLQGHTGTVWDIAVQGNRMVSCGVDQIIRIWNLDEIPRPKTDDELSKLKMIHPIHAHPIDPILQMFFTVDGEWVIWSKSGYYDASLHGDRYIGFHVNRGEESEAEFYASDRFANTLFRPDVIREIIKAGSEEAALQKFGLGGLDIEAILPPTVIFAGDTTQIVDGDSVPLEFQVSHPQDQQLEKAWILVNELPVWEWDAAEPGEINPSHDQVHFKIDELLLVPGLNRVKIMARTKLSQSNPIQIEIFSRLDEVNAESRGVGDLKVNEVKRAKPDLYVLAIGVSKYRHGEDRPKGIVAEPGKLYNLTYPHKDAEAITQQLSQLSNHGFKKVHTTVLTDAQATKANIESEIRKLGLTLEARERRKRKAKVVARDVAVIFMAGHGLQKDNDFYFLNYDVDPKHIGTTAVKMLKIGEVINNYKAEILMLTDACHSGQIGNTFNNRELTKSWQEINGRAQVIFSATTADNVSIEHDDWGHGAFTRGILDVIDEEQERTMLQFFPEVSNLVRAMTQRVRANPQKPTLTVLGVMTDFQLKRLIS